MAPIYNFCNVSVMPVRSEPTHRAEQTTQLLYGEKAILLETNNKDWARIQCCHDKYEGWCKQSQLTELTIKEYKKPIKHLSATHGGKILFEDSEMPLPIGCDLVGMKSGYLRAACTVGSFKGKKLAINDVVPDPELIKNAALQYLHAPYLWGGRSITGIDCSGLVQMAFKMSNFPLPRDAAQQASKGKLLDFLEMAECGDLAFFANDEDKIVHVGILLDNKTIIHATDVSGRVVVDRIDLGGIISVTLKRRTHTLRFVKRVLGENLKDEQPNLSEAKLLF